LCEALESTREDLAITAFERLFRERPAAGDPIRRRRSSNSLFNLSKLSVWWLRLGISIERIKPDARSRTPPRAHASDLEEGGNPATGHELPATTSAFR
jgi:hypothetical protein